MTDYIKTLKDTHNFIKTTQLEELKKLFNTQDEQHILNKISVLDEDLTTALSLLDYFFNTNNLSSIDTDLIILQNQIHKTITEKKFIINDDITKFSTEMDQTWNFLQEILIGFTKIKESIFELYKTNKSDELAIYVDIETHNLKSFGHIIKTLNNTIKEVIKLTQKTVTDKYYIEDLSMIKSNENSKTKFQNGIYSYIGSYTNDASKIIEHTLDNIKLNDIHIKYAGMASELYHKLLENKIPTSNQTAGAITPDKISRSLYDFSVIYLLVYKVFNEAIPYWKEYKSNKIRFYYYYLYQLYCLYNSKDNDVYIIMTKKEIEKYYLLLEYLIEKFNMQNYNETEKERIKYFNVYHYFTIKKLYKLFQFVLSNLPDDYAVDILHCSDDIYQAFNTFNQFKDLLTL